MISLLPFPTRTPPATKRLGLLRKRLGIGPAVPGGRLYWRVTLRSAPALAFILLGSWHEEIRLCRWRWLAKAHARQHMFAARADVLTEVQIEAYRPGSNVVSLFAASPSSDLRL